MIKSLLGLPICLILKEQNSKYMSIDLKPIANIVREAAFTCSNIFLRDFNEILNLQTSSFNTLENFSLKTQKKSAEKIIDFFNEKKPNLKVYSSEDNIDKSQDLFCIVKTLEGINNFKRGIPFCCNILALFTSGAEPVFVMVDNPILKESFLALKNFGSWFENYNNSNSPKTRMRVSTHTKPEYLTILDDKVNLGNNLNLGCKPLELAYLAAGRIDLIKNTIDCLTTKACLMMVKEAGGYFEQNEKYFVASNNQITSLAKDFLYK